MTKKTDTETKKQPPTTTTRLAEPLRSRLETFVKKQKRKRADVVRLLIEFGLFAFDRLGADLPDMPDALEKILKARTSVDRAKGES
jgi:predicted DNA-binding protein